jgi:hypothetical protein
MTKTTVSSCSEVRGIITAKPDQNPIKTRCKPIAIGLHPVCIAVLSGLAAVVEIRSWEV